MLHKYIHICMTFIFLAHASKTNGLQTIMHLIHHCHDVIYIIMQCNSFYCYFLSTQSFAIFYLKLHKMRSYKMLWWVERVRNKQIILRFIFQLQYFYYDLEEIASLRSCDLFLMPIEITQKKTNKTKTQSLVVNRI